MLRFKYIEKVPPVLRNKYILTIVIFILWVLLLDSNNLISRHKELKNLKKLKAEREYYVKRIEEDKGLTAVIEQQGLEKIKTLEI